MHLLGSEILIQADAVGSEATGGLKALCLADTMVSSTRTSTAVGFF